MDPNLLAVTDEMERRMLLYRKQRDEARNDLRMVRLESLLGIRQAAFAPEIGVRYTEAIRSDIERRCRALEDWIAERMQSWEEPDAIQEP